MSIIAIVLGEQKFVPFCGNVRQILAAEMQDKRKKEAIAHKPQVAGSIPVSKIIRAKMVKLLSSGNEFFIEEIADGIGASQTAVRRHLRALIAAGNIKRRAIEHNRHVFKMIKKAA